jgi:hypothetical protein
MSLSEISSKPMMFLKKFIRTKSFFNKLPIRIRVQMNSYAPAG